MTELSNKEYVDRGLMLLRAALLPFVREQLAAAHGDQWERFARSVAFEDKPSHYGDRDKPFDRYDIQVLLSIMKRTWNEVFRARLDHRTRTLVFQMVEVRNSSAHDDEFSDADAVQYLNNALKICQRIGAAQTGEVEQLLTSFTKARFNDAKDVPAGVPPATVPAAQGSHGPFVVAPVVVQPVVVTPQPAIVHAHAGHSARHGSPSDREREEMHAAIRVFPQVGRALVGAAVLVIVVGIGVILANRSGPATARTSVTESSPAVAEDPAEQAPRRTSAPPATPTPAPASRPPAFDELIAKARASLDQERAADAVSLLEEAVKQKPQDATARALLSLAYRGVNRPALSLESARMARELGDTGPLALANMGVAEADLGKPADGVEHCRKAIEIEPSRAVWHRSLAYALMKAGRLDDAVASARKAVDIAPAGESYWNLQMLCQVGQAKQDAAVILEGALKVIEIRPQEEAGYSSAWNAYHLKHDHVASNAMADRWVRALPTSARAHYASGLSQMLLAETNHDDESLRRSEASLRRAITLDPEGRGQKGVLAVVLLKGNDWRTRLEESKRLSREALRIDPADVFAVLADGFIAAEEGRTKDALQRVATLQGLKQDMMADRLLDNIRDKK